MAHDDLLATSGWIRVSERFKLVDLKVRLSEKVPTSLLVAIGIKLPRTVQPTPANSYFRNIQFSWED